MVRLLDAACAPTIWAIRPEALTAILALIDRQDVTREVIAAAMHFDAAAQANAVEAVATKAGTRLENSDRVFVRDGVATLGVVGPIVRYAGMFSSMSGGASVEALARDLAVAVDDPNVNAILLHIDSPGGEASGIAEMADLIVGARAKKPVWAYVSDLGASAGYWLASAAEQIVVAQTAALGSIGVVAAFRKNENADQMIEFVSSVSPNKRPDLETDDGRAQIQALVDTLGEIFVQAVATNRGTTPAGVIKNFGAGGLLVGQDAVTAGLADRLGSYEGTLRDLRDHAASATPRVQPAARPAAASSIRTAAVQLPKKGASMSFKDRFLAWLDSQDGDITASADVEAMTVATNLPLDPPPTQARRQAQLAPVAGAPSEDAALLARFRALEDENATLRAQGIQREAGVYVKELLNDLKIMPTAEGALGRIVAQLMTDDVTSPIRTDAGTVTRVSLLSNFFAEVPSRRQMLGEALDPLTLRAMSDRAQAERLSPSDQPDQARMDRLIGAVPMGVEIIRERNGNGTNGTH